MGLRQSEPMTMTRLLLSLWFLDGAVAPVKQSDLMKAARLGKEKVVDYAPIVAALVADGAIVVESVGRSKVFRLLAPGMDRLRAGVLSVEFEFMGTVVAARFVTPLLKFIREVVAIAPVGVAPVEVAPVEVIEDYEAFKPVLLDTYRELLARFNYNRLVPIYQIRRELGDRVDRETFNQWIIQAHKDDVLEMMDCGERNITPDEIADSVQPPFGRLWFFAIKR